MLATHDASASFHYYGEAAIATDSHFHVDLPTGLSDLADLGDSSGLDEHPSKRPTELSLKQG